MTRVRIKVPSACQSLIVRSLLPETNNCPFGEYLTELIDWLCPALAQTIFGRPCEKATFGTSVSKAGAISHALKKRLLSMSFTVSFRPTIHPPIKNSVKAIPALLRNSLVRKELGAKMDCEIPPVQVHCLYERRCH